MYKLQNMTIKQKLTAIIMLTSAVILLLAIAVFVIWGQVEARRQLVDDLQSHADIIANNCKASLAFSDKKDAGQILSALYARGSIVFACIYDKQGRVFVEYQRKGMTEKIRPPQPQEDSHSFEQSYLSLFQQIKLEGEMIGTVYLRDDMSEISADLTWSIGVAISTLLFVMTVAYFLSSKLQRAVSGPIISLAEVAKGVSEKKDYSTRAIKHSNDEVGRLIDTFNEMLEQIQLRDLELVDSKEQLEIKVKERVKHLNCLYNLSKLVERPEIPLGAIFQATTDLVHSAYEYPDKTCVRITFNGIQYKTDNFAKSELSQYAEIKINGEKFGAIEIYYLGERGETNRNPFIKEERELIDAIAEHLGRIADRKKTSDKLQLFRNLIDRSNDSIFIVDPKWGRLLDVNEAVCKNLGYTREELLEMTIKDFNDSFSDDSSWSQHIEEVRREGSVVLEGLSNRKDGTTFPVEVNAKLIKQGKEEFIIGVARDITERKQAEEKLKQAAEEWITTFNSITDLVSIQDNNYRLVRVNKACADALGMKPEEIIGKSCYELFHGTKEPHPDCPHKRTLHTKKPHRAEFFEPRMGVYIEASTSPIFDEKGEVTGSVHIVKDITERKRAEEALKKSESKYRMLLENIPQRVFLKDSDLIYVSCNENYACDLGIKSEEIAGKTDYEFYPKELAEKYREDDQKVIRSEQRLDIDESYIQNGHESIVHTVKTPVKDEQGNVSGVLGIFWDITAFKLAEERQAELLKQIESSNRELKDFAYIVSHDLKAPLRGIKTIANWITTDYTDKLDEEGREQLNLLSGRVDRMQNLIDGVLQYSRVGREKEKQVQVDLNKLVPEIIGMVAPPEDIEITVEDDLPAVTVEETRIMQVFQNLLSNAIKYMDKPKGRISIGCIRENGFWKFNISDNGPGIEEQHFEKIFQIFQTLKSRDEVESTGVGLSVVKKIVEMYGGKIWVESKPGEGSTFFFTFPKQESEVINDEILKTNITC